VFSVTLVVPGNLETRTGGYEYDRRIVAGLRGLGWDVLVIELADGFPRPATDARREAARALAGIPDRTTVLVDGLALGALPDEVAPHAARLTIVALVHHPLAEEAGLEAALAAALRDSERRALSLARTVVVTSRRTAIGMARYDVPADRIAVVEPGTDPAPLARGSIESTFNNQHSPVSLLCVATLTPRKNHDVLLHAVASMPNRGWRLTCAGSLDRDRSTASRVRRLIRELGIEERVTLAGDLDATRLALEYDRADLFVLPTLHEGYGMAVAEALARGIPVVSTATGAIPDLVCDGAGIVVPPGDASAFAHALSRVVADDAVRAELADGARRTRARLPTWESAAATMAMALTRVHE